MSGGGRVNEHIPPPVYLYGILGYKGKLCMFGGMTRNERLHPTELRTKDHLQDGATCKQYGPIEDKYWTNKYTLNLIQLKVTH